MDDQRAQTGPGLTTNVASIMHTQSQPALGLGIPVAPVNPLALRNFDEMWNASITSQQSKSEKRPKSQQRSSPDQEGGADLTTDSGLERIAGASLDLRTHKAIP